MAFEVYCLSDSLTHIDIGFVGKVINEFAESPDAPPVISGRPHRVFLIDIHTFETDKLVQLILEEQAREEIIGWYSDTGLIFLFISHLKTLNAWPESEIPLDDRLSQNKFFIQILLSYGLGKFVSYEVPRPNINNPAVKGLPSWDVSTAFITTLKRIVSNGEVALNPSTLLDTIKTDCEKLRHIAIGEIGFALKEDLSLSVSLSSPSKFLKSLSALYQLGRGPHDRAEQLVEENIPWLKGYGGSYKLTSEIDSKLFEVFQGRAFNAGLAAEISEPYIKLRAYQVLRDLARWLASGASVKTGRFESTRILVFDEALFREKEGGAEGYLSSHLQTIQSFYDGGKLSIDYVLQPSLERLVEALRPGGLVSVKGLAEQLEGSSYERLTNYHIILIDIEFGEQYIGPKVVQFIDTYFEQNNVSRRPSIIVFSKAEHFGHIQQCLNFGAEAYVLKQRIYTLPAHIARTRLQSKQVEPRGRRTNFRSLYQLVPRDIARLQSRSKSEMINGYPWDDLDKDWVRALPKADLHFHIGTSISLPAVEALALNTSGYLFNERVGLLENLKEEVVDPICQTVLLAGLLRMRGKNNTVKQLREWLLLSAATVTHLHRKGELTQGNPTDVPDGQAYDTIIKWLTPSHRQVASFEVCSLLVAAICFARDYHDQVDDVSCENRARDQWAYLSELNEWAAQHPEKDKLASAILHQTINLCQRVSASWHRGLTREQAKSNFMAPEPEGAVWDQCYRMTTKRINVTVSRLNEHFMRAALKLRAEAAEIERYLLAAATGLSALFDIENALEAIKWPPTPGQFDFPSLEELVVVPNKPRSTDQNLLRYLEGAGLLGAEHLQYPENILLAGKDIVAQSLSENIIYSEIRCATTGYCSGGMSALDATDLLCLAFDLSTVFYAAEKQQPWVRTNVLLGAKRQKPEEEFQNIVSLLTYYLQRGEPLVTSEEVPAWWKPSRVVGFDLSGDEAKETPNFEDKIGPLFTYCAPITIHAGEAATAESIWQAVYRLGARRIGHGLRLRENRRLLNYCITEGICMEMCPTSNKFTNGFIECGGRDEYNGESRECYPLRHYMEQGLDVCVNTDNRQLHEHKTLTDDYMCAARLVGGLTKWEVLKLIKAGFKHAFLPKNEIEMLLKEAEKVVYQLVTGEPNRTGS